jgi:hypothetical protein
MNKMKKNKLIEERNEDAIKAKHSNVSSFDHDACMVQFVFEERNEDASKALKCFFV